MVSVSVTRPQSSIVPPGQKATPIYMPLFCKAVVGKSAAVHPCHAGSSNPQAFRVNASWSNSRWWPGLEWHRGHICRHQRPLRLQPGALQLPERDSAPFAAPCCSELGSAGVQKKERHRPQQGGPPRLQHLMPSPADESNQLRPIRTVNPLFCHQEEPSSNGPFSAPRHEGVFVSNSMRWRYWLLLTAIAAGSSSHVIISDCFPAPPK